MQAARCTLFAAWLGCALGFAPRAARAPRVQALRAKHEFALLFDCDGVIVETEELHRRAYCGAFAEFALQVGGEQVVWEPSYYDVLQNTVGGGKPKMKWFFTNTCKGEWPTSLSNGARKAAPETDAEKDALVDALQDAKTMIYKTIVSDVATARPGVLELMDEAIAADVFCGICSAATRAGFEKVVDAVVGQPRLAKLDVIMAGDDVKNKKPDPEIYLAAAKKLGLEPAKCVVIEDSLVGLRAAKAAGMRCIITYTPSTATEDFYGEGADAVVSDLRAASVDLEAIFGPLRKDANAPILPGLRAAAA
ncbi:HAD-like domain-containing protein [Pelagophyceae sp. CCMP2097]|nr:HAD-like domain-containing protein [Pelagophyceae sp. CCMP2097]